MLFGARKRQQDAQRLLVRFINARSIESAKNQTERRVEARSVQSVGIWVIPMVNRSPSIVHALPGVTKELSSTGVGFIVNGVVEHDEVLLGLPSDPTPTFLRAAIRSHTPLGAGFNLIGAQVTEIVSPADYPELAGLLEEAAKSTAAVETA